MKNKYKKEQVEQLIDLSTGLLKSLTVVAKYVADETIQKKESKEYGTEAYWDAEDAKSEEKVKTRIRDYAYAETKETFVNIATTVKQIGIGAFSNSAIGVLNIPNGVEAIDTYAFENCKELDSITLPANLQHLGYGAFYRCKNLETIVLPNKLEKINEFTFSGCKALKYVKLPDSLKIIGAYAFQGCKNLKRLEIPDEICYIDNYAFDKTNISLIFKGNPNEKLALAKIRNVLFDSTYSYDIEEDKTIKVHDIKPIQERER